MTQALMKNGKVGSEILSNMINNVFTPSINAIYNYNGFISIFGGDAFNAVFPIEESEEIKVSKNAISAATEILDVFKRIGICNTKFGKFNLEVKVGAAIGELDWGIIMNKFQSAYYFRGEVVNKSAMSEKYCEKGEIIIDENLSNILFNIIKCKERVKKFYKLETTKIKSKISKIKYPKKHLNIQKKFYHENILNLDIKGEFRDIVSCFISFKQENDCLENISKVITLVNEFGGYFNKISFGDKGGFLLILFGAPVAKEKLLIRACEFTLLAMKNNKNLKIGMTYGRAFAGFTGSYKRAEYTAQGKNVNLAARFMTKANYGEIYFDENIRKKIEKNYNIKNIGKHHFKGFEKEIPVYKLIKKKVKEVEKKEIKLVGREKELKKLENFLKPLEKGIFAEIIFVDGEAGIGKSRLLKELKSKVEEKYKWFYFPCDEILKKSFNPIVCFLKNYFHQNEDTTIKKKKGNFEKKYKELIEKTEDIELKKELIRTKSFLASLIDIYWKDSLYDKLDAKVRYENILYGMKNLIKAESLYKPVIIELEDGHNIDEDSKKWIEVLIRNVDNIPFVIISACRFNNDGSEFSFNINNITEKRIKLDYLGKAGAKMFINNLLMTKTIPENTYNIIWNESEGNPFYIEQIILYLKDKKLFDNKFNIKVKTFEIPSDINSIIIARIDRLSIELRNIIQTASVIGREFTVKVLKKILKNGLVNRSLLEGEKESIWHSLSNLTYIFNHAIIRESIYQMQLKERLRNLHKLTAQTIESLYEDDIETHYAELVNHYEKAVIKDKTNEYLKKASKYAKRNFLNKQAIYYYDKLLENYNWIETDSFIESLKKRDIKKYESDFKDYIDIITDKVEILIILGDWSVASDYLKKVIYIAETIQDIKRIIECNSLYGKTLMNLGKNNASEEKYINCLELAKKHKYKEAKITAINNLGTIYFRKSNFKKAKENYEESLKLSIEIEDKSRIAQCIGNLGVVYEGLNNNKKAESYYKDAIKTFKEIGEKRAVAVYYGNLGNIYFNQKKYKIAMNCYFKNLNFREKIGDKSGVANVSNNIGNIYKNKGLFKKSIEWIEKSIKISKEIGDIRSLSLSYAYIQEVYQITEEYSKSLICLDKAIQLFDQMDNKVYIAIGYDAKGNLYKDLEDYDMSKLFYNKAIKLNRKLQSHYYLCISLINKANLLYYLKEFDEVKILIKEAMEISKKLKRNDMLLSSILLLKKIDFISTKKDNLKKTIIFELTKLSDEYNDLEEMAVVSYEIFNLLKQTYNE